MQTLNIFSGILNIACGIVFVLIGIPLVQKKVPMNKVYGFRISKAFVSDDNWYTINWYGGRQLIQWSAMLIMIGILYFIFPVEMLDDGSINVFLAVAPIFICISAAILKTLVFSKRL